MAQDLVEVTVLVSEHASTSIGALLGLVEGTAIFCSLFIVGICQCFVSCKFILSVGELTFFAITTLVVLDPVLAELSLVLVSSTLGFTC